MEDDFRQIFMRDQAIPKLYSSFLDLVLRPFYRITRRVDELSTAFSPLFKKYCEPLSDLVTVPSEDMNRKLFSHLQPFISLSLNETFTISSRPLFKATDNKDRDMRKGARKPRVSETLDEIDFHMSTSAKYMLISAFLASRNLATLDASLFDSTGGSDNRKRKRKASEKSIDQKEMKEQELIMKGPGTFPLERLLAIYQCIASVGEYSVDDEEQPGGLGEDGSDSGLISDILLQLSSLCSANFITKGGSCPLEGSTRYRSIVSEDMVLKKRVITALTVNQSDLQSYDPHHLLRKFDIHSDEILITRWAEAPTLNTVFMSSVSFILNEEENYGLRDGIVVKLVIVYAFRLPVFHPTWYVFIFIFLGFFYYYLMGSC